MTNNYSEYRKLLKLISIQREKKNPAIKSSHSNNQNPTIYQTACNTSVTHQQSQIKNNSQFFLAVFASQVIKNKIFQTNNVKNRQFFRSQMFFFYTPDKHHYSRVQSASFIWSAYVVSPAEIDMLSANFTSRTVTR